MKLDEERRRKIVKDHPNLFPKTFHFEHGDGWLDLVEELCHKLEAEIIKEKKNHPVEPDEEDSWHFVASQIKEKYGTLRFYIETGTDEMFELIKEAEDKSAHICEICGNPGYTRNTAWVATLCDKCMEKK